MHLKINKASQRWPIARKGRVFVAVPSHDKEERIPLLLVLRDILKVVGNRREAKLIIREGKVSINGKKASNDRQALGLFDIVSLDNKRSRIILQEQGKFALDNGEDRISKIIGKKLLSKGRVQINLHNGYNYIARENYNVGDSVIIRENNFETIQLKEGANVIVIHGKLAGTKGVVENIAGEFATISSKEGKHIIKLNAIMAIK